MIHIYDTRENGDNNRVVKVIYIYITRENGDNNRVGK